MVDRLLVHLLQIEEFDCGGIYLVNEGSGALDLVCHTGLPQQFVEQAAHYEPDAPQTRLIMTGPPIYRPYTELLPETKDQVRQKEGLRAIAVIPVTFEGQVLAALNLASHTHNEIPLTIRNAIETMATTYIGEVLARVKTETALQTLNTELEQRVAQRTSALKAANRELKDFAYVVSHDLKAPLRGISRLACWLSEDYDDVIDEKGKEMTGLLINRVKRMDALIDGILQYSRVGRIISEEKHLDLNRLVKDVIDMLGPLEHIQIVVEKELPFIVGDGVRITQVFQNLLSNAVRFMNNPDGKIVIDYDEEGDYWKFKVTDNGPGINSAYHEKIFQIFQTLKPRDEYESTGIGLALVKKIVELYGGTVGVESEVGKGTTFWFTFPMKKP
jgi:light-regulated signal transduction histidine kinase (bacteriophytochrome)